MHAGRSPTVITLGGFEAAMAGRLRESHTLPVLPQGRDDILFGSAEDTGDQVIFGETLLQVRKNLHVFVQVKKNCLSPPH